MDLWLGGKVFVIIDDLEKGIMIAKRKGLCNEMDWCLEGGRDWGLV